MKKLTPSERAAARARADELLSRATIDVRIDRLVEGGLGFGRVEGFPLLVARAAPGDLLRVKLSDRKKDYARAEIVEVLEAGADRTDPPCDVYDRCGGCDLQHIRVERQSQLKADAAAETLRRIGGVEIATPRVVSGAPFGYRSRAQLQVRGQGDELDIGFFERGSNQLVPTLSCPVLVPGLEKRLGAILVSLRGESSQALAATDSETAPAASAGTEEGDAEKAGPENGDTAQLGAEFDNPIPSRLDLLLGDDDTLTTAPATDSLPHRPVVRKVGDFEYELDARCFFQGHGSLIEQLITLAVGDDQGETVFELHAGVGLFTMPLARANDHVFAVESDRIAVRYLKRNAKRNELENIEVSPTSAEHFLRSLLSDAQRAEAQAGEPPPRAERWFFDPPRTGLSKDLLHGACRLRPKRITYVSCQPPTLARDLKQLHRFFEVEELTFVDLFPQTAHLETVVQLRARAEPLPGPEPDKTADGPGPRPDDRRGPRGTGRERRESGRPVRAGGDRRPGRGDAPGRGNGPSRGNDPRRGAAPTQGSDRDRTGGNRPPRRSRPNQDAPSRQSPSEGASSAWSRRGPGSSPGSGSNKPPRREDRRESSEPRERPELRRVDRRERPGPPERPGPRERSERKGSPTNPNRPQRDKPSRPEPGDDPWANARPRKPRKPPER